MKELYSDQDTFPNWGSPDFGGKSYKHSERSGGVVPPRSRGGGKSLRAPHPSTARERRRAPLGTLSR
jgi:hypothetical protein